MLRALIVKNYEFNLLKQVLHILFVLCSRYISFSSQIEAHHDN